MKWFMILGMVPALVVSTGCRLPASNYGYDGGYGAYGPAYNPYGQAMIPPPATGSIGYGAGYYQQPGYAPAGTTYAPAPYPSVPYGVPAATSPAGWQSVSPNANTGARNSPAQRPRPMPRNVRASENLAWQTPGYPVQSATVGYEAPLSYGRPENQPYYPPVSSTYSAPQYATVAHATADCGCNGTVAPASGALVPQATPMVNQATYRSVPSVANAPAEYAPVNTSKWRSTR